MGKALTFLCSLILFLALTGCQSHTPLDHLPKATMELPGGREIPIRIAISDIDQQNGLSTIKPEDWPDSQGLLFAYKKIGQRRFWMPDTYFNLDIIFLDPDFSVVYIERNVPAHPGRDESTTEIYRTPDIYAQHVLELKSSENLTKDWQIGSRLQWKSSPELSSYLSEK